MVALGVATCRHTEPFCKKGEVSTNGKGCLTLKCGFFAFLRKAQNDGVVGVAFGNTHPQTPSAREGAFYALRAFMDCHDFTS